MLNSDSVTWYTAEMQNKGSDQFVKFEKITCVSASSGSLQLVGSQGAESWALIAAEMLFCSTISLPADQEERQLTELQRNYTQPLKTTSQSWAIITIIFTGNSIFIDNFCLAKLPNDNRVLEYMVSNICLSVLVGTEVQLVTQDEKETWKHIVASQGGRTMLS